MENRVDFKVHGRYALFTDPISKIGGEKYSYSIPTYQSLKGILESVYWKPTLLWYIDKVRVINQIKTQTKGVKPQKYRGGNSLAIYTYLADVEYQVQAHFEWNVHRPDMENDRNENKHYFVAKRMIEKGGRRDIFLGTRDCQGYVEECVFGEGEGYYDQSSDLTFGLMFHGFDYPDESGENELVSRFWSPVLKNGVVEFERPKNCIKKFVKSMTAKPIASSGLQENGLMEGYVEVGGAR